ncbi:MAG TPA: chemotaxis protein CheB [Candidatus Limnocylindrales bacterium]|nr:chemotaxis protein CheB [Candidatus Limnocylindrales bacterium]
MATLSRPRKKPEPPRIDDAPGRGRAIALGASAGGVEALTRIVRDLPPTLDAPILVVLHVPPTAVSRLPEILARAGGLPAGHARHGESPRSGRIYVAPPDRHMIVTDGRLVLIEGPHENGVRPAADPLFRSAAAWYRHRLLGAVLSGTLDDGTAGLAAVRAKGGVTAAQAPGDAIAPGMPSSVIENVGVDYVLPANEMGSLLTAFVAGTVRAPSHTPTDSGAGSQPIDLVCPECGGVLRQFVENNLVRFHCRVGHTYSTETLYAAQDGRLEAALWAAIRSLEDSASLSRRLAATARERGSPLTARKYEDREREAAERADVVRSALLALTPLDETPPEGEAPPVAADAGNRDLDAVETAG